MCELKTEAMVIFFFHSIREEEDSLSDTFEDVGVLHHFSFQLAITIGRVIHHITVPLDTTLSFPPTLHYSRFATY